jgi:D-3-phosphoglycerate dehydrogenase / 2-oxoglutarate reductase
MISFRSGAAQFGSVSQLSTNQLDESANTMPTVMFTPEALVRVNGPWVEMLQAAGFRVDYPEDRTFTRGLCGPAETIRVLRDADALIAGAEFLTAEVLAELPKLRVIARAGVGYDRVDVAAATRRGIPLTITPTANHEAVAETVFALMFAIAKSLIDNDARVRSGKWRKGPTQPIRGQTLGLFGLGRIGRSTALRARAMGMTVIATETHPDMDFIAQHAVQLVDFETLLSSSDYLSVHCPLNAQTQGMFNRRVFTKMRPGSVFINTARGELVDESDLVDALASHLSAAGLDVFAEEPPSPDNPLFRCENLVASPHLGGADTLAQKNMAIEAAGCIIKLSRNEWPSAAVVNNELQPGWKW